jgi:hypothetical protein
MASVPSKPSPSFVQFRDSHHAVARMFAAGMTISKVAHETGYSRRRLQILLNTPAFQDLIVEYSKKQAEIIEEDEDYFTQRYGGAMRRAVDQICEALEDADENGERLPMRELLAIVKDAADRFGYSAKRVNINIDASFATRLDRAIDRSTKIIEARPVSPLTPPVEAPEHTASPHLTNQADSSVEDKKTSQAPRPSFTKVLSVR